MNGTDRLEKIEQREARATRGPWFWNVSLRYKTMRLESDSRGKETVMDLVRWGMNSAAARFRDRSNVMIRCDDLSAAVPSREHHESWFRTIDHPDADFIAHAREDVRYLCERLRAAESVLDNGSMPADIARYRESYR